MRNIFSKRKLIFEITQGSIITSCIADDYPDCEVFGLIITPRCDIANEGKVNNVHYLPIVNFSDWYKIDGCHRIQEKEHVKAKEQLSKLCKDNQLPTVNFDKDLLLELSKGLNKDEKETFKRAIERYFNTANTKPNTQSRDDLLKNLIDNKISTSYLIENWDNTNTFKVILLRDLKKIEYSTAKAMQKGLFEEEIKNKDKNELNYTGNSTFECVQNIQSPYIEHIIERFSYNFCRIGVSDMSITLDELLQQIK